ncbi:hypothetical protein D934_08300 [Xylella fastidiosa subsp. sandyi Ann-1]|uniref:Uncharacterized protein n=1 Tax=Xylella fastidiosa subsp. sandyi Ann-1 TaxID=155920 RepID=A0A060H3K2_XYLFS|nr:hypothetical protein D934_08300 [Xylella fastidiosa subsp. sandyi Ann-1]
MLRSTFLVIQMVFGVIYLLLGVIDSEAVWLIGVAIVS